MENIDISAGTKELLLDTKGACFLCLKDNPEETEKKSEINLRNICHYLSINTCNIIRKSVENVVSESEKQDLGHNEKRDISVIICENCFTHTKSLSNLIYQMDVIKLRMNYRLQELQKFLLISEQRLEQWEIVKQKMMPNCNFQGETGLVENLRKEVSQKVDLKIKAMNDMVPKVQLNRLNFVTKEKNDIPKTDGDVPKPAETAETKLDDLSTSQETALNTSDKQLLAKLSKYCQYACMSHNNKLKMGYRCRVCKKSKKLSPKAVIYRHFVNVHAEKLFAKNSRISEEKFQICCESALKQATAPAEDNSFASSGQSRPIQQNKLLCLLCQDKFCDPQTLRCHMVFQHFENVSEKVGRLQEEMVTEADKADLSKMEESRDSAGDLSSLYEPIILFEKIPVNYTRISKLRRKNNPKKQWTCTCCGRKYSSMYTFNRHKRVVCARFRKMKSVTGQSSVGENKNTIDIQETEIVSEPVDLQFSNIFFTKILPDKKAPEQKQKSTCSKKSKKCTVSGIKVKLWSCSVKRSGCGRVFSSEKWLLRHKRRCPVASKWNKNKMMDCNNNSPILDENSALSIPVGRVQVGNTDLVNDTNICPIPPPSYSEVLKRGSDLESFVEMSEQGLLSVKKDPMPNLLKNSNKSGKECVIGNNNEKILNLSEAMPMVIQDCMFECTEAKVFVQNDYVQTRAISN